jgi:hypothetical protein
MNLKHTPTLSKITSERAVRKLGSIKQLFFMCLHVLGKEPVRGSTILHQTHWNTSMGDRPFDIYARHGCVQGCYRSKQGKTYCVYSIVSLHTLINPLKQFISTKHKPSVPTSQKTHPFVNNQLDAQFFFMYVYFYSLHVSGNHVPIIRSINCINTTSGISMRLIQTYTPSDHLYRVIYTRCCIDTINSPHNGHMAARNV